MSKKKSTLNDLEEFLKLQASSLVTPSSLEEKTKALPEVQHTPLPEVTPAATSVAVPKELTEQDLIEAIHKIAPTKNAFYDLLLRITETVPDKSKEDVLLINTALYLKGGANWKEVVRDYWKDR